MFNDQLLNLGTVKVFAQDTSVFSEGDKTGDIFLLLRGVIGLYSSHVLTGDKMRVMEVRQNEFFGEIGAINNTMYLETAVCETECEILVINRFNFHKMTITQPETANTVIRAFLVRLKSLYDDNVHLRSGIRDAYLFNREWCAKMEKEL